MIWIEFTKGIAGSLEPSASALIDRRITVNDARCSIAIHFSVISIIGVIERSKIVTSNSFSNRIE